MLNTKLQEKLYNDDILSKPLLGEVVEINDTGFRDTEKPAFRVKVKIFGVTDKIPKSDLPFYLVKGSISDSYNIHGKIPRIGTYVYVTFPDGDIYNGIVDWQPNATPPNLS